MLDYKDGIVLLLVGRGDRLGHRRDIALIDLVVFALPIAKKIKDQEFSNYDIVSGKDLLSGLSLKVRSLNLFTRRLLIVNGSSRKRK